MIDFSGTLARGTFTLDAAFKAGGGITAIVGPSGSGKTTILHLIAGLLQPSRGHIQLGKRVLADTGRHIHLPSHKRRAALVFQDAQLFPHLTVAQNLGFARRFVPKDAHLIPADRVLDALGIGGLQSRRPAQLSGGEKQRVALARALFASPEVLLLDEPLASLDVDRKNEILPLIEHIRDAFDVPILYVTHARDEVMRLASHVIVLDRGRIIGSGAPGETLSLAARHAGRGHEQQRAFDLVSPVGIEPTTL